MENDILDTLENREKEDAEDTENVFENIENEPESVTVDDILDNDMELLREEFTELFGISDITDLPNPTRYAALRDLGLTPREAYLATLPVKKTDNRSHLVGGVPHAARSPVTSMTRREWNIARALFDDMSDLEIEKLYKKVTR